MGLLSPSYDERWTGKELGTASGIPFPVFSTSLSEALANLAAAGNFPKSGHVRCGAAYAVQYLIRIYFLVLGTSNLGCLQSVKMML